jgi:hypothetical protein
MIQLTEVKTLTLQKSSQNNRPLHLSAASGLVQTGDWLYVVADDENHLAQFRFNNEEEGTLHRLFSGDLPLVTEERKSEKPDIEVLTLIPPSKKYPFGALLALGSGSKKNRKHGAILPLDHTGDIKSKLEIIKLEKLYDYLKEEIGKLNIEGAVIMNENLVLFQRGNKKNKINATISMKFDNFYDSIFIEDKKQKLDLNICDYDLGDIEGVPLCFTDATALPNGHIIFTAAAENTSDSYNDGFCAGSAIGVINNGVLISIEKVDKVVKLEGVTAKIINGNIELLLVTDADNIAVPACLYSAKLDNFTL